MLVSELDGDAQHDLPYLVADIGGGSTELASDTEGVESARSLDVGCVRLSERHLRSDPPDREEVEAAWADVEAALAGASVPIPLAGSLIGLAGSVTTAAAIHLAIPEYDDSRPASRAGRRHRSRGSSAALRC
jgi:exopolyphosphatase/guanosine-5'-triphosphate,3'-diphosphate pyrophosphatase